MIEVVAIVIACWVGNWIRLNVRKVAECIDLSNPYIGGES